MTQTTRTLTYRGPAALVSTLAHLLEEEGVRVEWEPPLEKRGTSEVVDAVVATLIATGAIEGIKAAVRIFTERTKGKAEVVQEEDDGG